MNNRDIKYKKLGQSMDYSVDVGRKSGDRTPSRVGGTYVKLGWVGAMLNQVR